MSLRAPYWAPLKESDHYARYGSPRSLSLRLFCSERTCTELHVQCTTAGAGPAEQAQNKEDLKRAMGHGTLSAVDLPGSMNHKDNSG